MPPLEHMQSEFIGMLRDSSAELADRDVSPGNARREGAQRESMAFGKSQVSPKKSQAIYRRNYRENHLQALIQTFEYTVTLVGEPYFRQLGCRYLAAHPSASGDLNDYGETFAGFLEELLPTVPNGDALPYLADVSRLDWARLKALRARQKKSMLTDLLVRPAPLQQQARIQLHPACTLISSAYPLYSIWQLVNGDASSLDLGRGAEHLVVCRPEGEVHVHCVNGETAYFLAQWQKIPLGESLVLLNARYPRADLGAIIANLNWLAVIGALWR